MAKVIPIVVAILIFLGAGLYVLSNRSTKITPITPPSNEVNVSPNDTTPTPISSNPTLAPLITAPTADQSKNQITLKVSAPLNNTTVTTPTITVKGTTSPGADVAVNDKDVVAGSNGSFSASITLDEGDNYIYVVATDADGKAAETDLNITLNTGN